MSYPPELAAHLGGGVTTVCRCWRLTRRDGVVLGFTDHDLRLEVDGASCEPQSGFSASEAKQSLGLTVDAVDVEGALSSARISADDIESGRLDGASVETFLVNWRAPDQFAKIGHAIVGKMTVADGRFTAELESRMRFLDQPNGRYVLRRCDAELGDQRCGVNLAGFSGAGSVIAVEAGGAVRVSGLAGFAAGWFTQGVAGFASGALEGRKLRIARHGRSGSDVVLTLADDGALPEPGDAFSITAGCDKSFASCKAKFSNAVNFRGFPHLPGNDRAYAVAKEEGVFDGKPVVP